jgi:hypothetical protein
LYQKHEKHYKRETIVHCDRSRQTAPETLQFVKFHFRAIFDTPVARQSKRFGQNFPGKVLKVMSAFFEEMFSKF